MREYLCEGDLVVAEIQQISNRDGKISLHIRSEEFGKLKNGTLVDVCHDLVKKQVNHLIKLNMGLRMIIAMNGKIWLEPTLENLNKEILEKIAKFSNIFQIFDEFFIGIRSGDILEIFNNLSKKRAFEINTQSIRQIILKNMSDKINERSLSNLKDLIINS